MAVLWQPLLACILDQSRIPSLLWGELAVRLVGDDSGTSEIEFIVPDSLILSATRAQKESGFPPCNNSNCSEQQLRQHRPNADVHFHLEEENKSWAILSFFKKSKTVWWLPDSKLQAPAQKDPHLTLSNDHRLPPCFPRSSGPWENLYPNKILQPSSLVEAVIRLMYRDIDQPNNYFQQWKRWMDCLLDNPDDKLDPEYQMSKSARPDFQRCWQMMNSRWSTLKPWLPLYEVRYKLGQKNELPPPLPIGG